jgi:hypothetical protein
MSLIRFHVFSGTGNSRHLVLQLNGRLESKAFATVTRVRPRGV